MKAIVFYDQPTVSVVVTVFLLLTEADEEMSEPLADLHHEGNTAEKDVVPHFCNYGSGCQLSHLGSVVLSFEVCDARGSKGNSVCVANCLKFLQ